MALVPCRQCGQPFYASCHDASCIDALCPSCEYAAPAINAPLTTEGTNAALRSLPVAMDSACAHHPTPPTRPTAHPVASASHPVAPSQGGRR